MKRIVAPIIILLLLAAPVFAQVKNTITNSKITFEIKNLGINTGGAFSGLQANIQFDAAHLNTSAMEATVDVNTINTGSGTKDDHLKSAEFFDVAHFPQISMKSASFKHRSGNNYTGQFSVTIKGKTKLIDLPFTYTQTGATANFKGTLKLNRLDFGVGDSSLVLSNDVVVTIEVGTTRS